MGTKAKNWVLLPEHSERWLFKFARVNLGVPTGEHWAEKIAAEVADVLGIPHARVELAELNGRPGCISRRFPELSQAGTELVHGNDLLAGQVIGYDRSKRFRQSDHTLNNIVQAVSAVVPEGPGREAALQQLGGYLMLDALVLNTDRHHENWALFRVAQPAGRVLHRVAPSFDHASSLGRNEPTERLRQWEGEEWRAAWYARRARGAVFLRVDDAQGLNPLELAKVVARLKPDCVAPWLERLRQLNFSEFERVAERVPGAVMSSAHKSFSLGLMRYTLGELQKLRV